MEKDVRKELDKTIHELQKKIGKESVSLGGVTEKKIPRWDIESLNISYVLGGGLPKGRIIELFGPESGGKTSMCNYFISQVQKQGGVCAVIDMENSYDFEYAEVIGVNTDDLIFSQPNSGENALDIAEELAKSGHVKLIVIDSVAALTPQAEIDGEMGSQQMGLQAKLMAKACRKLSSVLCANQCTVIFINQIREKIGVMYGNPETTSGGRALKFYASIRFDVRKIEFIKEGSDEFVGLKSRIKAVKNKTAPPYRKAEVELYFDSGYDTFSEFIDFGVHYGVIQKGGAWYTWEGERFQGKDSVKKYFKKNLKEFEKLKEKVIKAHTKVDSKEDFEKEDTDKKSSSKRQKVDEKNKGDRKNDKESNSEKN